MWRLHLPHVDTKKSRSLLIIFVFGEFSWAALYVRASFCTFHSLWLTVVSLCVLLFSVINSKGPHKFIVFARNHTDHGSGNPGITVSGTRIRPKAYYIITQRSSYAIMLLGRSKSWEVRSVFARDGRTETSTMFLMHWAAWCHCFSLHVVPASRSYTDRD